MIVALGSALGLRQFVVGVAPVRTTQIGVCRLLVRLVGDQVIVRRGGQPLRARPVVLAQLPCYFVGS